MPTSIRQSFIRASAILAALSILSGCMVAKTTGKVAALPFKGAYHTTKLAGKGVYGTGKLVGKTTFAAGKGVYYMGSVPVKITDKALDTTTKVLSVTTNVVDLSGKVITTSRLIQSYELESELMALRGATNVLSVLVDAA